MPNRLAQETSPYLLQHMDNPVDWYPWGEEAIARARNEQKPIFLSIGYSACHWCHVMEHESFEDATIAEQINAKFVPIKVDREERPDLDQIYMNAVQMLTGHGGWPMSVFLTPDLKPFYGGTYWPPRASRGMPGFDQILAAVSDAWRERRDQAIEGAEQLTVEIRKIAAAQSSDSTGLLSIDLLNAAVNQLHRAHDTTYGGFGSAPKFPHPMALALLLGQWRRSGHDATLDTAIHTLDRMAAGGIYDHLGGGFARYSVDVRWLVPHFEKMLYDNGLLVGAYLDAFLATGEERFGRVVRETLDYVLRDMTDPAGGFYSTEDADSEGHEGLFYTWTPDEITAVLGPQRAATFSRVYGVTDEGNFEGRTILHLPRTVGQWAKVMERDERELGQELADSRAQLFAVREERVRPGRDDKVLVSWNGLMIDSMARAGAALGEDRYVNGAEQAARFILQYMRDNNGRLLHTWRNGQAKLAAYLDDYACLANALVSVYEATFDERWLASAMELVDVVLNKFSDPEGGGFFYTAADHEELIARTKELTDASTPSGNGMAATVLVRLGQLLGRADYLQAAERTLDAGAHVMRSIPMAAGQLLLALDRYLGPSRELLLVGDLASSDSASVIGAIRRRYLPRCVIAARDFETDGHEDRTAVLDDAFAGKSAADGEPTLYVCEHFTCQEPVRGVEAILERVASL
jgi:uncharacterized protein YyaL (SSP411 family)